MTTTPHPNSFAARLDREWAHLRRRPRSVRAARSWAETDPGGRFAATFAGVTDLQHLLDLTRGRGAADLDADALLCRLIEIAAGDTLAGRIVIQRILPGLISTSVRYRSHRDGVDPIEIVVAAAWIAMRRYDVQRRSRHVAASLISDATFQAFRRPLRRLAASEELRSPHDFKRIEADVGPTNAADELSIVLRDAAATGVAAQDVELIRRLLDTDSPRHLARECGVTARTIRNRRRAAITRVRDALLAA